jgi:hypothetical protein
MARKQIESNGTSEQIHFPPERIVRLLVGIKSTISMAEARTVSAEDLQNLTGRPAGTIGSWLEGGRMHQLEFLIALLERLPASLRHDLLDAACRALPTLQHPKLAHDPVAVSRLEALLKQRTGFTVIQGAPEHARAFLLDALGNSARWANFGQQPVVGVNIQSVSAWAPVPGVFYLSPHADTRQQFQRAWSKLKQAKDGSLILLGGVWSRFPSVHSEVGVLLRVATSSWRMRCSSPKIWHVGFLGRLTYWPSHRLVNSRSGFASPFRVARTRSPSEILRPEQKMGQRFVESGIGPDFASTSGLLPVE